MNSKDLQHLYDREYFLKRVEGHKDYAQKKIYPKKIESANRLDFKGKDVLDVGFGRGEIMRYCYLNGARTVTGIDYAPAAVDISKTTMKGCDDVKVIHGDLASYEWGQLYDCIYLVDVVEHVSVEEIAAFLDNIPLSRDAQMLVETPCYDHGDYKGMHINYMSESQIHGLLKRRFKHVETIPDDHWWIVIARGEK